MYSEKYWLTVFAIISLSLGCNEQASKIGLQSTGFIQVRQAKLHYVVEGTGQPILVTGLLQKFLVDGDLFVNWMTWSGLHSIDSENKVP